MSGFLNVDPTRDSRLQRELKYQELNKGKFNSDAEFEAWKVVVRRRHMLNVAGYVGVDAIGEQLLKEAEEEYKPISAAREVTRIKAEKEEALSKVINQWVEEKTPVFLTLNNAECPEVASGRIVKFSGFENPKAFVILRGQGFARKIAVSEKWAVSENSERISGSSFEINAAELDTDAIEKLFGLPVSELRFQD